MTRQDVSPSHGGTSHTSAAAASAALTAVDVVKQYGSGDARVTALDRLSVAFERHRFTAIVGPSGSGKSTLLHCLAGLDRVDGGRVLLGETELGALSDRELTVLRRERIGLVFQAFNLVPMLDARENIELTAAFGRLRIDRSWLDTVVSTVGLSDRLRHRPSQLSGGQQQRVAIARALVTEPDVVLADEPTGNLDSHAAADVLGLLRAAADRHGQSVVMVTHDPFAAARADRVVVVADGRLAGQLDHPRPDEVVDVLATVSSRGVRA